MDKQKATEMILEGLKQLINLNGELLVFSGNANPKLAEDVCKNLGLPLGKAKVTTFSDGETQVEIQEDVRGSDVFVIQPTCAPVNNNIMELLILIDALKRSSARRITAVTVYYGYGRQDRKVMPRAPISAKLVADLITAAGANRLLSIDLHAGQIQGFFNLPFDHLFASLVMIPYIEKNFSNIVIVSPDAGGVERARAYARRLNADLAIVDKRREAPNKIAKGGIRIIGEVNGCNAVIVDDIVDTGGTLKNTVSALLKKGAKSVSASCVHPVLSGMAVKNIMESKIKKLIVTDTIPLSSSMANCPKIKVLTVSQLLANAIEKIHNDESVSSLFI